MRVWVQKYEAGELDDDAAAADTIQAYDGLAPQKWRALVLKKEGFDGRPEANLYLRVSRRGGVIGADERTLPTEGGR